jgi:hypothetical protein
MAGWVTSRWLCTDASEAPQHTCNQVVRHRSSYHCLVNVWMRKNEYALCVNQSLHVRQNQRVVGVAVAGCTLLLNSCSGRLQALLASEANSRILLNMASKICVYAHPFSCVDLHGILPSL